jgi:hypothetical protein
MVEVWVIAVKAVVLKRGRRESTEAAESMQKMIRLGVLVSGSSYLR